jgi:hypothetical protein
VYLHFTLPFGSLRVAVVFKNEVSASQRKRRIYHTDHWINTVKEVIGVYSDNHSKQNLWVKYNVFLMLKKDVHVTTAVF